MQITQTVDSITMSIPDDKALPKIFI